MADRLQRGTILPINHPFFSSLFQISYIFSLPWEWLSALKSEPTTSLLISLSRKKHRVLVVFCLTENLRSDKDKKNLSTDYRLTFVSLFFLYSSLLLILNKEVINQWPLSARWRRPFFFQSSIQNFLCFTIVVFVPGFWSDALVSFLCCPLFLFPL